MANCRVCLLDARIAFRKAVGSSVVLMIALMAPVMALAATACSEEWFAKNRPSLSLELGEGHNVIRPGGKYDIRLNYGPGVNVAECVRFSLESDRPEYFQLSEGAARLIVSPDAPHGVRVRVKWETPTQVLKGAASYQVIESASAPLVGRWQVKGIIGCDGAQHAPQSQLAKELIFDANGKFSVTWRPFESYVDYWGDYVYDSDRKQLSMIISGGNYVPAGVRLQGVARVTPDGNGELQGIWLGAEKAASDAEANPEKSCGLVIKRY